MPKVIKPEAEPRLQGESSRVVEWARRITQALNPLADTLLAVFSTVSASISQLKIKSDTGTAELAIDKGASGFTSAVTGYKAGLARWQIELGNVTAEAGANAGSDFSVNAYNDAGSYLYSPLQIIRSSGVTVINKGLNITAGGLGVTGTASFNNAATLNPVNGIGFSPAYATDGGGNYYCNGFLGSPNWESVSVQFFHQPGVWAGFRFIVGTVSTQVFTMQNNGTGYSAGGWVATSDGRFKINRAPITNALAKCAALTAYAYDRTDCKNLDGSMLHQVGLIAQDVQAVLPAAVLQDPPTAENPEPTRSLNYDSVTALAVQAINELSAQVAALRAEIQTLKGATSGGN